MSLTADFTPAANIAPYHALLAYENYPAVRKACDFIYHVTDSDPRNPVYCTHVLFHGYKNQYAIGRVMIQGSFRDYTFCGGQDCQTDADAMQWFKSVVTPAALEARNPDYRLKPSFWGRTRVEIVGEESDVPDHYMRFIRKIGTSMLNDPPKKGIALIKS